MAASKPQPSTPSAPAKLPQLPSHAKVQKRPLLHPPIVPPYKNRDSPKVVYVSSRQPFMATVKRVRKLLHEIDKRATQSALSQKQKQRGDPIVVAAHASVDKSDAPEEVVVKATGKAIEKAMSLALFFQQQEDCRITLRTGTVDAIDDIVEQPLAKRQMADDEEELPETRTRRVSLLEIVVTLR
ncbi:hypothetical protein SLS56_000522 [Neofusicoccum ribis]|uniref:Uncharacterized protein n=1 Tax=Neofusicoccum ribis TaxID=45134 RepID=A0ABR3TCY6_9PEZI